MKKFTCLLISILLIVLLYGCENSVETTQKIIANAGQDQTIPSCSYAIFDASNSDLGENKENVEYVWEQNQANPKKLSDLWSGSKKKHIISIDVEGMYIFDLNIKTPTHESNVDRISITVTPREVSVIKDKKIEGAIRFYLGKQQGLLSEFDFENVDSLLSYQLAFNSLKVQSLDGIEYCKNLKVIELNIENIVDLNPIKDLKELQRLSINQNYNLSDLSPLANLTKLEYLDLDTDVAIKSILALRNLANLKYLNLLYIDKIVDFSVIKNMQELETLYLSNQDVRDLDVVESLSKIKLLWLAACEIEDISNLKNLVQIEFLFLKYNNISDITPLKNLTKLSRLYLTDNSITDISVLEYLPNLNKILLSGNKIADVSPLLRNKYLRKGDAVFLKDNPLSAKSINEYIPKLIERGITVIWN